MGNLSLDARSRLGSAAFTSQTPPSVQHRPPSLVTQYAVAQKSRILRQTDAEIVLGDAVERTALQYQSEGSCMDAQLKYSDLLYTINYGIPLRKPSYDINVGDLCNWSQEGKATRILNIFDNHEVCPPCAAGSC